MSYPINLSITGKPSPRTDHPASAGSRRAPMTANRIRNQKSNIFCLGSDLDQMEKSQQNQVQQMKIFVSIEPYRILMKSFKNFCIIAFL